MDAINMQSTPLVTIGIPTYNRPQGLKATLDIIIGQTYKNLEIIISDNCSPDSDVKVIAEDWANKDSRVKYIRQLHNIGMIENFNFVMLQAEGDYFSWIADDDYWDSNYIEECIKFFIDSGGDYSSVAGNFVIHDNNKEVKGNYSMDTEAGSALRRMKQYFKDPFPIVHFYGIKPTAFVRLLMPFQNKFNFDSMFMGNCAFLGKMKTLKNINQHYFEGGLSSNREKNLSSAGLPEYYKYFTAFVYLRSIFTTITKEKVYRTKLSWVKRSYYAWNCCLSVLFSKFLIKIIIVDFKQLIFNLVLRRDTLHKK
jgi:glycosyltransferase involved in cell wall biosynthesis